MDAASPGSTVKLAAGCFYVNQGIVVQGFNGTLRGTLSDHDEEVLTTLEAVAPFQYSHATGYLEDNPATPIYDDRIQPSVIFFEFPEEEITVRDLIFIANAPAYVVPRPMWGNSNPDLDTTALTQFIGDFGNNVDPTYLNLTFIAGSGDYLGSNVAAAIHSMRGPGCPDCWPRVGNSDLYGIGNAIFKRIRASNIGDYVIVPMWYKNGSIVVEDVVSNIGAAVTVWGAMEMTIKITDVESTDSRRSLELVRISGGKTKIRRLTSLGGVSPAIFMSLAENVDIRNCVLSGANGFYDDERRSNSWRAPISIRRQNRNITFVDNAIVNMIDVPMAVIAMPYEGNTGVVLKNNEYDPDNFPGYAGDYDFDNFPEGYPGGYAIVLGSDDSRVVEPTLQPDQVGNLGVNNTIKLGSM